MQMQKIAIPLSGNKLSPHFAECQQFKIYNIKNHSIVNENFASPPSYQPDLISAWLIENGITDVIAAGIELRSLQTLNRNKVNVFVGVKVEDPENLVKEYIDGILETHDDLLFQ